MKKYTLIAAIAAVSASFLSASCAKQELSESAYQGRIFSADIEQASVKTSITSEFKVNWDASDQINICGAIYSASPRSDASRAHFTLVSGTAPNAPYKAIFPASLYNEGSFELPAVQDYSAGKFNAPMYAESSTEDLLFKNICGVLRFSLKGTEKIRSIAVTANEAICGAFTISNAKSINLTGTNKTVVLDCKEGVQLNTSKATDFFIYLPPNTYSAGMKIVFKSTDGRFFEKSTVKQAVIAPNNIYTFEWATTSLTELPKGALPGIFSVSETKKVRFSKGNLQTTYNGSGYTLSFAANQYDCIGNAAGNTTIGSQRSGAVVDLFYWSTDSANYGISSTNKSGKFVDWGTAFDNKGTWRTLSGTNSGEWAYLFDGRRKKYGVTVCGHTNCIVLAPNGYKDTIANSYDAASWEIAETAGLVCLPAAGFRSGSTISEVGNEGYYWSSTPNGYAGAYDIFFFSGYYYPVNYDNTDLGISVRLVTECQ